MKRTLAFLLLSALPLAASAQMAPPSMPMGPRAAASTTTSNGRTTGITVNASDMARVPATSAQITLNIGGATPQTKIDSATLQPIIDALAQAGADPASVQLPPGFPAGGYSNNVTISAVVKNPTSDMMKSGVLTVGSAIAKLPTLRAYNAQVTLHADDCSSAIASARSAAIALARKKAQAVAHELGVGVGSVISVTAYDNSMVDSSCTTQYNVGPSGPQFYNGPYGQSGMNDYTTIPVSANVTITFAIK